MSRCDSFVNSLRHERRCLRQVDIALKEKHKEIQALKEKEKVVQAIKATAAEASMLNKKRWETLHDCRERMIKIKAENKRLQSEERRTRIKGAVRLQACKERLIKIKAEVTKTKAKAWEIMEKAREKAEKEADEIEALKAKVKAASDDAMKAIDEDACTRAIEILMEAKADLEEILMKAKADLRSARRQLQRQA